MNSAVSFRQVEHVDTAFVRQLDHLLCLLLFHSASECHPRTCNSVPSSYIKLQLLIMSSYIKAQLLFNVATHQTTTTQSVALHQTTTTQNVAPCKTTATQNVALNMLQLLKCRPSSNYNYSLPPCIELQLLTMSTFVKPQILKCLPASNYYSNAAIHQTTTTHNIVPHKTTTTHILRPTQFRFKYINQIYSRNNTVS